MIDITVKLSALLATWLAILKLSLELRNMRTGTEKQRTATDSDQETPSPHITQRGRKPLVNQLYHV